MDTRTQQPANGACPCWSRTLLQHDIRPALHLGLSSSGQTDRQQYRGGGRNIVCIEVRHRPFLLPSSFKGYFRSLFTIVIIGLRLGYVSVAGATLDILTVVARGDAADGGKRVAGLHGTTDLYGTRKNL